MIFSGAIAKIRRATSVADGALTDISSFNGKVLAISPPRNPSPAYSTDPLTDMLSQVSAVGGDSVYRTIYTRTGAGILQAFVHKGTTTQNIGVRITIDGTVIFTFEGSSLSKGIVLVGAQTSANYGIKFDHIPFRTSLLVQSYASQAAGNVGYIRVARGYF